MSDHPAICPECLAFPANRHFVLCDACGAPVDPCRVASCESPDDHRPFRRHDDEHARPEYCDRCLEREELVPRAEDQDPTVTFPGLQMTVFQLHEPDAMNAASLGRLTRMVADGVAPWHDAFSHREGYRETLDYDALGRVLLVRLPTFGLPSVGLTPLRLRWERLEAHMATCDGTLCWQRCRAEWDALERRQEDAVRVLVEALRWHLVQKGLLAPEDERAFLRGAGIHPWDMTTDFGFPLGSALVEPTPPV